MGRHEKMRNFPPDGVCSHSFMPFVLKAILLVGLLAGLQPATASDRRSAGPTPAPGPTATCRVRLLHFYDDSNNQSDVLNALNSATAAVNADSSLLSTCTMQIIHTPYSVPGSGWTREPNKRLMVKNLLEAMPIALDSGGYDWPSIPSCIPPDDGGDCYSITAGT